MDDQPSDPDTGEVLDHKGRRLNAAGQELPDPSSLAPPIGFIKQPPLHELIRQMVRSEALKQLADGMDYGSFEEEEDFDIPDDDYDPQSPWEEQFDPPKPLIPDVQVASSDASKSQSSGADTTSQPSSAAPAPSPGSTTP